MATQGQITEDEIDSDLMNRCDTAKQGQISKDEINFYLMNWHVVIYCVRKRLIVM